MLKKNAKDTESNNETIEYISFPRITVTDTDENRRCLESIIKSLFDFRELCKNITDIPRFSAMYPRAGSLDLYPILHAEIRNGVRVFLGIETKGRITHEFNFVTYEEEYNKKTAMRSTRPVISPFMQFSIDVNRAVRSSKQLLEEYKEYPMENILAAQKPVYDEWRCYIKEKEDRMKRATFNEIEPISIEIADTEEAGLIKSGKDYYRTLIAKEAVFFVAPSNIKQKPRISNTPQLSLTAVLSAKLDALAEEAMKDDGGTFSEALSGILAWCDGNGGDAARSALCRLISERTGMLPEEAIHDISTMASVPGDNSPADTGNLREREERLKHRLSHTGHSPGTQKEHLHGQKGKAGKGDAEL